MRTIAHISDLHFGRHDPRIEEDLLRSVGESQCDLVAISGDFTQRARRTEFEAARRFLDRIPQPKLLVPGNHDVPLYNVFDRILAPWTKYDRYIAPVGVPDATFSDAEIAVLGLNTARRLTRKNGRVSHIQLGRIRAMFSRLPEPLFKILVTHHPLGVPSDPEGHPALELAGRSELALSAVATAGVHLLLSGHHHRALGGVGTTQLGGGGSVLVLHAGTAISTRTRDAQGNSYNLLRIAAPRVELTVMSWLPTQGFSEQRTRSYVLQGDRWLAS